MSDGVKQFKNNKFVDINHMKLEKSKPYLADYLKQIRGTRQKYKRVCVSPLRYAGGKSNAVGLILENLPNLKEKKIVSVFFGGGSFEFVMSAHLGFHVIGYDIFGMLVNFWDKMLHDKDNFVNELTKLVPDRQNYTHNRHILLNYWEKIKPNTLVYNTRKKENLTDHEKTMLDHNTLLQAVYYYYNMQLSYGPMFLGWPSSVYLDERKYKEIIERIKRFDAGHVEIKTECFETSILRHPDNFLFLDPPYYLGEGSRMFKGMYPNCNFAIHHNDFPHKRLLDLLKKHKGGFFLTYNDCPMIRTWYSDYKQVFPSWQYTFGQGEKRIGKNREDDGTNIKDSHEIFIICPPL